MYFERGEGQRGSICTDSTVPDTGLSLMDCRIMTWAEIKSNELSPAWATKALIIFTLEKFELEIMDVYMYSFARNKRP